MPETNVRTTPISLATIVFAVALWVIPAATFAQTVSGTMQGTVIDTNGAVLSGVTVTIKIARPDRSVP